MNINSLYQLFEELQDDVTCILCEGKHGNNTLCQAPMDGGVYEIQ